MEKVSDDKKRLKSIVTSLLKSVECPVCLETVKPPFKVCVRGHGVCLECVKKLEKCPLCQESFTLENLVCVKTMLEALPHLCSYSDAGCGEVVEPGNDHEMFCGYRPIVCRYPRCSVKMPLVQFLDHCKIHHSHWWICNKESTNPCWKIKPESLEHLYTPVSLFNNLFWVLKINDDTEKQFKIYFQATPIGKLEHDYYVRIKFKKGEFVYTYTLKAQVLSSCETKFEGKKDDSIEQLDEMYCMKIPQKELSNFTDDEVLRYSYNFFKK